MARLLILANVARRNEARSLLVAVHASVARLVPPRLDSARCSLRTAPARNDTPTTETKLSCPYAEVFSLDDEFFANILLLQLDYSTFRRIGIRANKYVHHVDHKYTLRYLWIFGRNSPLYIAFFNFDSLVILLEISCFARNTCVL